jgi:hypothetical protein
MTRFARAALVAAGLGVLGGPAHGQPDVESRGNLPDPAAGYDWRAATRQHGLGEGDIEALARDKVRVGTETFRQVFTPYLCLGAVLPYHEFAHPRRLTDAEWKALLDSKDRPAQPDWLGTIQAREAAKPSGGKEKEE